MTDHPEVKVEALVQKLDEAQEEERWTLMWNSGHISH